MNTLETVLQMVRELFQLDILELSSGDEEREAAFARRHQLHPVQQLFSVSGLNALRLTARPDALTLVQDPFYMETAVVSLKDKLFLFGPFVPSPLSSRDAADILKERQITGLSVRDFLSYRESYPDLAEGRMEEILRTLIRVCDPGSAQREIRKVRQDASGTEGPGGPDGTDGTENSREDGREHYIHRLQQRYEYEQRFMDDIRRGRARSALLNLRNMQQDVSYLKRIGTTLENERIGAAITRTSARIAAVEAGLPPFLIDRITSENTRAVMSAQSVSRILQSKEEMVLSICRAVTANSEHAHSALAQSALYYLEHEYYRKIRLDEMAADLETSRTKLIQVFRKEYGVTPIEYLNRFRMQKAAFLLGSSDKNIQEISQIVGIGDANYFVKVFRRQYGKTPGEYRKQNKV